MITVSEVIKRSCLRKYPVLCGLDGLENEVLKSGIIDYEFSIDGFIDTNNSFQYGDFLISSLMFTQGKEEVEEKLIEMLQKLVQLGVSGLAVKDVFFTAIPENALKFCNEHSFPVILFDNEIYFEEIVNDIDHLLQLSDWVNKTEQQIALMLGTELSRYEVEGISRELGVNALPYIVTFWLKPKQASSQMKMKRIVQEYSKNYHRNKNCFLFKYKQNYIVLVVSDETEQKKYNQGLSEVLNQMGIDSKEYIIGVSCIHSTISELDFSIKESSWSCQVATLLHENIKKYSDMGTWAIVTAHYQSKYMIEYMRKYLRPILMDPSESSKDLLETLIVFVANEGNTKLVAKTLNIHENTFRYRINKLREKLDPNANDFVFYENASTAVKIYLLDQLDRNIK